MTILRIHVTAGLLVLLTLVLHSCPGGSGGGSSHNGSGGTRGQLERDYQRDPDAYKDKWGLRR